MALPSGDFVFESSGRQHRFNRDGVWQEIDTKLVPAGDKKVRPAASPADVVFSTKGDGPFATMKGAGADFTLSWHKELPEGEVVGDSVKYPEVYTDVDLVVRATPGGFSHVLVVKSPKAAALAAVRETTYRLGGSAKVVESDGALTVSGPAGELASAPQAAAWDSAPVQPASIAGFRSFAGAPNASDSSVVAPGEASQVADVDVRLGGGVMTVAVDPNLLNSSHYPIYVDPTYERVQDRWIPVSKRDAGKSWTSGTKWPRDIARVGDNYDDRGDVWRSHFQFNVSAMKGKRLIKTPTFEAYATKSGHCAGQSVELWQSKLIDNATWNGMNGSWMGSSIQSRNVKNNPNCDKQKPGWVQFDAGRIKDLLQDHADRNHNEIAFGLRMDKESGGNWAKFDPKNVKLKAEFQHRPHSPEPTRSAPGGNCNRTGPGNWINDNTPTLYGKAQDGDGTVKVRFDLTGPTDPAHHTGGNVGSNSEGDWTTPALADGNYDFRVEGYDGTDYTGWSHQCFFRVDATPPVIPLVKRVSGTPEAGAPVTLEFASSDALSGLRQFEYGIGVDARQHTQSSTGKSPVTFTPEAGRTVVYVWAVDHAGNSSARTVFNFYTGRVTEAQPKAVWRFNGDLRDGSAAGNDVVVGTGVTLGDDRAGQPASALRLTGQGCAETGSVMRGDAEFTVAGWVKLADKSKRYALVSQAGAANSRFQLAYVPEIDSWMAVLSDLDAADGSGYTIAQGSGSAPVNVWQHIAATVDPVANVMRLYIDGKLAGEKTTGTKVWHGDKFYVGCWGGGGLRYLMDGAIDDVGVWQGLLSEEQIRRAATELPAGKTGQWQLRGDGSNRVAGGRDVTVAENASWADDAYGRSRSALVVNAESCPTTAGPTIRTDESFTVASWVKAADNAPDSQTFLGQDGAQVSGFTLGARQVNGATTWAFGMSSSDTAGQAQRSIASGAPGVALQPSRWTHLAGVYNATDKTISLYVDGKLTSTAPHTTAGWHASGVMTVGCGKWEGAPAERVHGGAISDVQAWQGSLNAGQVSALHQGNPPVVLEGMWLLDGPATDFPTQLADSSGKGRNLSISGDYSWTYDRGEGRDGALGLELADGSCARTDNPAVRTDSSFTVAGWVLVDKLDGTRTVMSQAGPQRPGFQLDLDAGKWRFAMASTGDGAAAALSQVVSQDGAQAGQWTHLAGVYDLAAGKVRLYVNGKLQGEAAGPTAPWTAAGPTLIGCAGTVDNRRSAPLGGVVDDVRIWTSTLHPDRIGELANAA